MQKRSRATTQRLAQAPRVALHELFRHCWKKLLVQNSCTLIVKTFWRQKLSETPKSLSTTLFSTLRQKNVEGSRDAPLSFTQLCSHSTDEQRQVWAVLSLLVHFFGKNYESFWSKKQEAHLTLVKTAWNFYKCHRGMHKNFLKNIENSETMPPQTFQGILPIHKTL